MKKLLELFVIVLFCKNVSAQNFHWAKSIGGYFDDGPMSISVDKQGNVYTTGAFNTWADFDPGVGTYTLNANGGGATPDIFISKLDINGNFNQAYCIGSTGYDVGIGTTVDENGNLYTTGYFSGTVDFDPSANVFNLTASGTQDIYINKYDSLGNLIWAKHAGGSSSANHYIYSSSITCDTNGNIYVTGYFFGWADFDIGATPKILTATASYDVFIFKLDTDGNYGWVKKAGGNGSDRSTCVSIGKSGSVYISGYFDGTCDFDPGAAAYNLSSNGTSPDMYLLKLNNFGNFVWAKRTGNTSYDYANSIDVDASENVYTTGLFKGTVDFDPGSPVYNLASGTNPDAFISKLDSAGKFIWAKQMGGSSGDSGISIKLDSLANIYVTGYFSGNGQYTHGANTYTLANAGNFDVYIMKLDSAANYVWAQSFGGAQNEYPQSLSLDDKQNIYICGSYSGTADFDPTAAVINLTSNGTTDIFIIKFGSQLTTDIKDIPLASPVSVFPNPNNGNFKIISKEKMTLILTDELGQIIQKMALNEENYFQQNIEIMNSGIYFISGEAGRASVHQKIIVKK